MVGKGWERIGGGRAATSQRLLVGLALMLGLCAGCEDEACFSWTKQEGACPSRDEAMPFFVSPGCVGSIESVDSNGEFVEAPEDQVPGDLCCYTVTKSSDDVAFCQGGGF